MELKVKGIKVDAILNDKGFVTDTHTLTMIGSSSDGELEAKLVFKAMDPKIIEEKVRMVHGTKMILKLNDANHTLDEFGTPDHPPMTVETADAYYARLKAANAQD